jgi:hypothetical protein
MNKLNIMVHECGFIQLMPGHSRATLGVNERAQHKCTQQAKRFKTLVEDSSSLKCRRMSLSTNVWAKNVRRWWIRRSRRILSPPFARMTPLKVEWYPSHRDVVLSSLWLTPALRHTTHISALLVHCVYASQISFDICTGETLLMSCRLH